MSRRDFWIAMLLLTALWAIFFFPALALRGYYFHERVLAVNFPLRALAADQWRNGIVPLWNPYCYAGFPLLAEGQAAVFYPLNILFVFLPAPIACNFFIVLHFWIAAWGMLTLLKRLGAQLLGSLMGTLTYSLGSYFIFNLDQINFIVAMALAPFTFYYIIRAVEHYHWKDFIKAGLIFALALLGGLHSANLQLLLILLAYLVFKFMRRISRDTVVQRSTFFAVGLLLFAAAALTLASVQLFPFMELSRLSIKPLASSYEQLASHSLPLQYLPNLFMPFLWGNPARGTFFLQDAFWEYCGYVGILPLVLAAYVLRRLRDWRMLFLGAVCLLFLLLSLGQHSPLAFVFAFPGLKPFHAPVRLLFIYIFTLSILTSFGVDRLLAFGRESSGWAARRNLPLLALTLVAILLAVYFIIPRGGQISAASAKLEGLFAAALEKSGEVPGSQILHLVAQIFVQNVIRAWFVFAVIFGLSLFLLYLYHCQRISAVMLITGVMLLHFADLYRVGARYPPLVASAFYHQTLWARSRIVAPPQPEPPGRVAVFNGAGDKLLRRYGIQALLSPEYNLALYQDLGRNTPAFQQIPSLTGSSDCELRDHHRFEYAIFAGASDPVNNYIRWGDLDAGLEAQRGEDQPLESLRRSLNLLNLANVQYLLTVADLSLRGWKKIPGEGPQGQKLYYNRKCLPRAYWTPEAVSAGNADQALHLLLNAHLDPRKTTVLTGLADTLRFSVDGKRVVKAKIRWEKYAPREVQLRVTAPARGVLVLADTYYPGWSATVDGKKASIYPANACFRGLIIPRGQHVISFRYNPASFRRGFWISTIGLVFWIGFLLSPRLEPAFTSLHGMLIRQWNRFRLRRDENQ